MLQNTNNIFFWLEKFRKQYFYCVYLRELWNVDWYITVFAIEFIFVEKKNNLSNFNSQTPNKNRVEIRRCLKISHEIWTCNGDKRNRAYYASSAVLTLPNP